MPGNTYRAQHIPAASIADLARFFTIAPTEFLAVGQEPEDLQRDNNIRAGYAAHALIAYGAARNDATVSEDLLSGLSDLLGDLRHLADATGVDFACAVDRSEYNYGSEIAGAR